MALFLKSYNKIKNEKSGFTLIELIIVLVILGIILSVAVPAVTNYVEDARDVNDQVKLSMLNKASQAYEISVYHEKKVVDIFAGTTPNEARQELLIDEGYLDEIQIPRKSEDVFNWDVATQQWILNGVQSSTPTEKDTIMKDLVDKDLKAIPSYVHYKVYSPGDIVKYGGAYYKWVSSTTIQSSYHPENNQSMHWKKIQLSFLKDNSYELGDVILDPSTNIYYRAILDSKIDGKEFAYKYTNTPTDTKKFEVVEFINGKWQSIK